MAFSLWTRFFYSWKSFSNELVTRVAAVDVFTTSERLFLHTAVALRCAQSGNGTYLPFERGPR